MKKLVFKILALFGIVFLLASCETAGFSLLVPTSTNLQQGSSVSLEVKIQPKGGFASEVALKIEGLPQGVTATFTPATIPLNATSILRLSAATGANLGAAKLTLVGQAGSVAGNTNLDLSVALPKNYVEIYAPNPTQPAKVVKLPVVMQNGVGVYQGDIVFPASRVVGATGKLQTQGNVMQPGYCQKGWEDFCLDRSYLWSDKTVPYAFDSSATQALRDLVKQAADVYRDRAAIRLVERTNQDDYILIKGIPSDSNRNGSSDVGRLEGEQDIELNITKASLGTVLHEFGHALGLWHEQGRADRDQYIEILEDNIDTGGTFDILNGSKYQFEIKDDPDVAHPNGPYDFYSIMHYPLNALSKNGQPTMRVKNPAGVNVSQIGQRTDLSPGDVLALADLYDAPVTDGSIRLRLEGDANLIAGGTRLVYINVVNDGPRTMQDLNFAITMPAFVGLNNGSASLNCQSPTADDSEPGKNKVICYTPGGIPSGAKKMYGPIKITMPTGYTTGFVPLKLTLQPIGTRLADPKKAISNLRLCNINPRSDPDESDTFANPLMELKEIFNPLAANYTLKDCNGNDMSRYTLHNKDDVDYFIVNAVGVNTLTRVLNIAVEGGPSYELYNAAGERQTNKKISVPGKYIVKVFGTEASLYTVDVWPENPAGSKVYDRFDLKTLLNLDPSGPIIKDLIGVRDNYVLSNKDLSYFTAKGAAGMVMHLYDSDNKLVFEQKSNADNYIATQLPGSDGEQFFRVELERQVSEETSNGITVENSRLRYEMTGYGR